MTILQIGNKTLTEFEIIAHYFQQQPPTDDKHIVTGIGDDAAIVDIPSGQELVVTTDTLVEDVHFFADADPFSIGHKALAVNLSDLAAMGATPKWVTLALTMPEYDANWLTAFCAGFFALAQSTKVSLIGGDTTRGPLSVTVQAMGLVPKGRALLRNQAKPGDIIYVTGYLGDAGCALAYLHQSLSQKITPSNFTYIMQRLVMPTPRVAAGIALLPYAHAAIDISDGLVADLNHVLMSSHVGAEINIDHLPISKALRESVDATDWINFALTAGDDYELCFTVPPEKNQQLIANFKENQQLIDLPLTPIGAITANSELKLKNSNGSSYHGHTHGFEHF